MNGQTTLNDALPSDTVMLIPGYLLVTEPEKVARLQELAADLGVIVLPAILDAPVDAVPEYESFHHLMTAEMEAPFAAQ